MVWLRGQTTKEDRMNAGPERAPGARRVAVFGAGGHTGRFVVRELQRRGFAPLALGRNLPRLEAAEFGPGVEITHTALDDPASFDRALESASAVINCAGPFLDTANAVAAAALRARIHYLDVTAEQASAQATLDTFDRPAREVGVVVLPAMGFYGGLGDLLATAALGDWVNADAAIHIALDSWQPTEGTRATGRRNTARRLVIAGGKLAPLPEPAPHSTWDFPAPFGRQAIVELPFSETVLIVRHLRLAELHNWITTAPLADLRNATTPPPKPADASGRSAQKFLVEVVVRKGNDTRRATVSGRDIYATTAPLVCEALARVLDDTRTKAGAFAPGELFDSRRFMEVLAPEHFAFQIW
jgi:short subunit dehydrogenase-like uncharacterized protein